MSINYRLCTYNDSLLVDLSSSGVGCYKGLNSVGALAYADDIVLTTLSPSAMREILPVCDDITSRSDVVVIAEKSKFLIAVPHGRRP
jgi:hypothetical protein